MVTRYTIFPNEGGSPLELDRPSLHSGGKDPVRSVSRTRSLVRRPQADHTLNLSSKGFRDATAVYPLVQCKSLMCLILYTKRYPETVEKVTCHDEGQGLKCPLLGHPWEVPPRHP